jgi:hypothetical protein
MKLLNKLEKKLSRFAIPNLTMIFIVCQVAAYLLQIGNQSLLQQITLIPNRVLQGEVWRLVSFLFEPPITNAIFAFFFWYLFYLMGTSLEHTWGAFRYNLYLLIGYLATVGAAFIAPDQPASCGFLQGSVFLAFAYLFPDFQLMLFFILPVKIKWLALLQWVGYFYALIVYPPIVKLMVAASVCNFFLFFWKDIVQRIKTGRRRMVQQAQRIQESKLPEAFHCCRVCGITDQTHPEMEFRYCSQCKGGCCYCSEHLRNHEHVT